MPKPLGFRERILWILAVIFTTQMEMLECAGKGQPQMKFTAATMEYKNAEYLRPTASAHVVRKSRTEPPVFEAFLPFIRDIPLDANMTFQMYQKVNNAWLSTILKGSIDFCRMIEGRSKVERMLLDYSDFPKKCPVKKGNYNIKDFRLMTDKLPVAVRPGEWRARLNWGTPTVALFTFSFDLKVSQRESSHRPGDTTGSLFTMSTALGNK